jgi:lipid-A-disaccharide synthase
MALAHTCDLFVVAGEPSGDAYAAEIVRRLRARYNDVTCAAMGGPALAEAGAEIEQDIDGLAVMGLGPVLARLPFFIQLGLRMAQVIRSRRPKVVLTVDYPGFNLRLARRLADMRRDGTRFVHVVAPQVWAWKPRRAKSIAHSVDRLLCFFPFEPKLFNRFSAQNGGKGGQADFVGHPLLDLIPNNIDTSRIDSELKIQADERLLLLAPGSRPREVKALLSIYQQAGEAIRTRLQARGERIHLAVAKVPELSLNFYRELTDLPLIEGQYRQLCARAHVGIIASGTATLEAAIIGLPHVIAYRTDHLTGKLVRRLVLTEHLGLPNLIAKRRVCPEVMQDELSVERLVAHVERLWSGPRRADCLAGLTQVRHDLGAGGAIERIVDIIDSEMAAGKRRADTLGRVDMVRHNTTRM